MTTYPFIETTLDPETLAFYRRSLTQLLDSGIPFLVGGAYAFQRYTGIERHTKDFDVFARREDCERVLDVLGRGGCRTELTFPHWLGKAYCGHAFVDVIFSSGNGITAVDDGWFEHAIDDKCLGIPVKLCPAEEMVWSKAFIMERERFDGADVAHLIRARGQVLDWPRLLARFGSRWRVLFSHLVMFGFIYPAERSAVPRSVMTELLLRLEAEIETPDQQEDAACHGTLLSREQYLVDVTDWGYEDPRLQPRGEMTPEETGRWTDAINERD